MIALQLLLLLCCSLGTVASPPHLQPPPVLVTCWGPHGQVTQQQDNKHWASCLWNSSMNLCYQPAPGARPEAERKEEHAPSAHHCFWYLNSSWTKNASHWAGRVTLRTGHLQEITPPLVVTSLLTVKQSCVDLEVLIFSSSSPFLQSFTYLVWFIPTQHPTLQCEWTFHLQLFGRQKDQLLQNHGYIHNDHIRNITRFVRRSASPFNQDKYTGFVAKVNCSQIALTPAPLRVRVNNYDKKIEAPVSCLQSACRFESLYIQKPFGFSGIMRRTRGSSFFLYVIMSIPCSTFLSVKPLWRVYRVHNTSTIPDWDNPMNSSSLHGVETIHLTVPSFTLDYGLYLFYFTISVTPFYTETVLKGSDQIYVQIERSDLVANIAGGRFRSVGFYDDWTLDGSASYDPDSQAGLKGISFTWFCTKDMSDYKIMRISLGKKCHPSQRDLRWLSYSGPVQRVPAEFLRENAVYYFRLQIQKGTRSSYADQRVDVQPRSRPLVDVVCIENCGSTLIPTERFILSGRCLNCPSKSHPVYYWSLLAGNSTEISFDWSSRTTTGRFGAYLSIHALTFTKTAHQFYTLLLKVTTRNGRSSIYRHAFEINSPPRAGKCSINPRQGTAFLTKFIVHCHGFSDSNLPLTYKVIVASDVSKSTKITSVEENTFGTILYFGYQPRTPPSFLPAGEPSQQYTLTLHVQVRDSLGAFTQVDLGVRVQNPDHDQLSDVLHNLLSSVSDVSMTMTSYLQKGDYFGAGYLTYITASFLNYIKAVPTLQLSKAQFRESLIKLTLNISVQTTMEVNQVVAALRQVTEEINEMNLQSQDLAIRKLAEVTEVLKITRNESNWSEEAEIQSSGILSCLSNIMEAALLHDSNVNVKGVKQIFSIMGNLTDIVFQGKVPGEEKTLMETGHWNITLSKDENQNITNVFSDSNNYQSYFYPSLEKGNDSRLHDDKGNDSRLHDDTVICTALFEFHENPFPWLGHTSEMTSSVLGFKMTEIKANGDLVGIMPEAADVTIARKHKESSTLQITMGPDKTQAYTTGGFSFEVRRDIKKVYIQILSKLKVTFQVLVFAGTNITHTQPIASFDAFHNMPTLASKNGLGSTDCNIEDPYFICLPEPLLTAIAHISSTDTYTISIVLLTHYVVRYQTQRLVSIRVFSDQCLFLDGVQSVWREDTCKVGSLTDWMRVHCVCHMKQSRKSLPVHTASSELVFDIMFLAAKVIVMPNRVDLGKVLIAEIPKNPVTLLTVLLIFTIYILLAYWTLRKDRAERDSKNKIIVLTDNDPYDQVSYLVTLYTGSRCGAGTKADVFLQLTGQDGISDVHCLRLPHIPSFQRGSADCFLLTTKRDLGDICALRIWHNNKGPCPSWFLSRATVENMSTRKTWFFMCRTWISLEKSDCSLDRTFSVTDPKSPLPRIDWVLINFARNLSASHMWYSVFAHTVPVTFSRFQRLSLCLTLLLLNLLLNIMFFNAEQDEEAPIYLRHARTIIVGLECSAVTMPLEMILTALFKYFHKEPSIVAQTDPKLSSPLPSQNPENWKEPLQKLHLPETSAQSRSTGPSENLPGPNNSQSPLCSRKRISKGVPQNWNNYRVSEREANVTEEQTITPTSSPMAMDCQRQPPSYTVSSHNYTEEGREVRSATSVPSSKRLCREFCWWYILWSLIITVNGVSSYFIVSYGLSYGYQTSQEWLLASAFSFMQNVIFLSVLKIFFFSATSAIYPKSCEKIPWSTREKYQEVKLPKEMSADEMREQHMKLVEVRHTKQYKPLEANEIASMLKQEKIKTKGIIFIVSFLGHLVFLVLLLNVTYSAEKASIFHYNQFIHSQFSPQLPSVARLEHIYMWLRDSFLPLIHNDAQPTFLPNSRSKIIGLPQMRQVRAKGPKKKCFPPYSVLTHKSHCLHQYGSDTLETGDYNGTWTEVAKLAAPQDTSSYGGFTYQRNKTPWMYYSYGDLHTYRPAGYTFYLFPGEGRSNSTTRLDALQQNNWLDEKTWAVIIELTTLNPDVNLFCTISVIFELSHLGIIKPSLSVHSFALLTYQQNDAQIFMHVTVLVFLFIYLSCELFIMCQEKTKYFKNISNVFNFGFNSVFLLFVSLKVVRFKMGEDMVNFFLLHPNDFIPFHAVSHLDQILRITQGFFLFLVVLKTLKYLQIFYDVRLAQRLLLTAFPAVSSMALVMVVCFLAFTTFGYLAFGQHEQNYKNMIHSVQTIVSYCVSAFRDTEFSTNRLLGGLFLTSFVLVMICILINLFQAVIMSAYRDMKQLVCEEPSDEVKMANFLLQELRRKFYLLICKKSKPRESNFFHNMLYGQPGRRHQSRLVFQKRKITGEENV